jgi:hypothetical protein
MNTSIGIEIESHPDHQPTYRRWLSVCLSADRCRADAEARACGHAFAFIARRTNERQSTKVLGEWGRV